MDLICTTCGEPWDLDTVLHDEPDEFKRSGAAILRCPSCPEDGSAPELDSETRAKLLAARELGELLAHDVDGYASELSELFS